mmetsp:Transcript_48894/g.163166  ORF Transcript_48894/g.163166 Transcript_48894/m.163166 type:complete len:263 (-) Transcript_48894:168-956(-)
MPVVVASPQRGGDGASPLEHHALGDRSRRQRRHPARRRCRRRRLDDHHRPRRPHHAQHRAQHRPQPQRRHRRNEAAGRGGGRRSSGGGSFGGGGGGSLFPGGYLEERTAPFSNAEGGQLFAAGALGLLNFGGCAYLGSLLAQLPPGAQLPGELGAVQAVFPLLLAYAVSYVAIPAVRFARLQAKNAAVAQRNANRRAWRDALRRGGSELQKRLEAASRRGKKLRLVSEEDVAFDSSKSLAEQPEQQTPALDDFDRRLRDATR